MDTNRFHQFLTNLHTDSWLIDDPTLPLGRLTTLNDLYLQGTFQDFTPQEILSLLLGIILLLYPTLPSQTPFHFPPHNAPSQQEAAR